MNKNYIDDIALIRLFVTGRANLAANEKLRVQSALDTYQLLAHNGQILAIAQPKASPPEIGVRPQSDYVDLLDKTLRAHSFLPIETDRSKGLTRYKYYGAPVGYQVQYSRARMLWREWWIQYRQRRPQSLQTEFLILTQQQWYPIRDIAFSHSTLFVTTHRGETAHRGDDFVIWAEKVADQDDEPTQVLTAAQVQGKATRAYSPEQAQPRGQHHVPIGYSR
ncbi:MAG: hypothetical protein AAF215_16790 [Cyanobacteria bacterium P01_A01_bin.123]